MEEEAICSNRSIGSLDPNVSTQDIYSVAGELIDALMSEDRWNELSDELARSDYLSDFDNAIETFVEECFDDKTFDESSNAELIIPTIDDLLQLQPIDSELASSSLMHQQQLPDQMPSELYSPTSLSRSTTPASTSDCDYSDVYEEDAALPIPIQSNFDRIRAKKVHDTENLLNSLIIYQTSQGNNFLSQSQKPNDEKQPDDDDDDATIEPYQVLETNPTSVTHYDDDDEVVLTESELIEVKVEDDDESVEKDEEMPIVAAATSKCTRGVKRKSSHIDSERVFGSRNSQKRHNNREAAKRYREKKKQAISVNKQKVAALSAEHNDLKAKASTALYEREMYIKLLVEKYKKKLPLPDHFSLTR